MTTALEDWGNQQRTDDVNHEAVVDEDEIVGAQVDVEHVTNDEGNASAAYDTADDDVAAADAEALAKKKKQGTQVILAAGGLCVALVIGIVGVGITKRNAAQQVEAAQQTPEQHPMGQPADLEVAPVGVAASATVPTIIMEHADGSSAIGGAGGQAPGTPPTPDFGLQTGVGAPVPGVGPSASAQVMPVPAPVVQTPAPVAQAPAPAPATATALAAGAQKPQQALAQSAAPKTDAAAGEYDKLRADVAALRAELAEKASTLDSLRGEVSGLRAQLSTKPAVTKPAAAKPAVAKAATKPALEVSKPAAAPAVVVVTEKVQPNNTPPAAAPVKGKVRSDFRIYAAVDGRFWVVGPDNEPVQVGVRSPLSDGSRVTSIDTEKNIIFTTAGEIR